MKQTSLLVISLLCILSACSEPQTIPITTATASRTALPTQDFVILTPKSTYTPTPVEEAERWDALIPYANHLFIGDKVISPDGQWIITTPFSAEDGTKNQIIAIEDSELTINVEYKSPGHESELQMYEFDSWSPDSTAIAGIFGSGERHCCGNGVAVSNFSNGKSESWVFHWNWDDYPTVFWANDSSKIGLGFYEYGVWLFDRKGNLIDKYPLKYVRDAIWVDNTIFAVSKQDGHNALYTIDLNSRNFERVYDFDNNEFAVDILGYVQESKSLVLVLYPSRGNIELAFLDLQAFSIKKNISLEGAIFPIVVSIPFRYIGIEVDGDPDSIWIFDVEYEKLDYYGRGALIGWYTNVNGFLVVTRENNEPKIIKP